MEQLLIDSSGPLKGTVTLNGAKNAVLPILAACLLTDDVSVIQRAPHVTDVLTMAEILRRLGAEVQCGTEEITVHPGRYEAPTAPYELVSLMRASICVLGPLLAKRGHAQVAMPGGCVIGSRPIDLHLHGLAALGAQLSMEHGDIAASTEGLRGARVHLGGTHGSSVLATANVMMAATLADGTTVIEHAACEPEVVDLADCLVAMGARIDGQGSPVIRVEGVERLRGVRYTIIPDRIEAGTLMIATAIAGGEVTIEGARADHLGAVMDKLAEAGTHIERCDDGLRISRMSRARAVDMATLPFPGFPTDLQAPMTALMATAEGVSVLTEKIYPERFMHVSELNRMGAHITREGPSAIVKGVSRLSGAQVVGTDLRAAAALLLAGLGAEHQTQLRGLEHLDRGYQGLEQKLSGLGARIRRIPLESSHGVEAVADDMRS